MNSPHDARTTGNPWWRDDGTVSMIDTATCNAIHTTGCATPAATIDLGGSTSGLGLDPMTHTPLRLRQRQPPRLGHRHRQVQRDLLPILRR